MPEPEFTIRGEVVVESIAGTAYAQRWWSDREHAELLRFGREPAEAGIPREGELIAESHLVGLLDLAWTGGLLSDWAKRQIFHLLMRRYEESPDALWAAAPTAGE